VKEKKKNRVQGAGREGDQVEAEERCWVPGEKVITLEQGATRKRK
jgi:hypothetical protein